MASPIGMEAGAALLALRRDLEPNSAPTLEELRSVLAQVERSGTDCWTWRGPKRLRFRDLQWIPRRVLYHWFGGTLASNQRLGQTCAPPAPEKRKRKPEGEPTLVQVLEAEDNVFEVRVVQELLVYPRRKRAISRCVNPRHQIARQALPGESTDDSFTSSSSSSSSSNSSAYGSDVTIETVAPHRRAREVCQSSGISRRKYRKLTAPNDKPDDG